MLACTMGNKPLAFRFLGDYFDLLPGRGHRTINAIQDEDPEEAMDAIISLKIASAMVGAPKTLKPGCRVLEFLVANANLHAAGTEATPWERQSMPWSPTPQKFFRSSAPPDRVFTSSPRAQSPTKSWGRPRLLLRLAARPATPWL